VAHSTQPAHYKQVDRQGQLPMAKLQRLGGISALLEASIYVSAFLFYGAFWNYPVDSGAVQKLAYLAENKVPLYCVTLSTYVLFGVILLVLVLAINERLKAGSPALSPIAAIFGLLWVGLVIAAGMISNVGLLSVTELSAKDPELALTVWVAIVNVVEGMGGGNEIVGGLWVLLLSVAALGSGLLSKALSGFGIFVGAVGIITIIPVDIFTEVFGVSQIVWFVWLGCALLRRS
jgi:hypothetical protein